MPGSAEDLNQYDDEAGARINGDGDTVRHDLTAAERAISDKNDPRRHDSMEIKFKASKTDGSEDEEEEDKTGRKDGEDFEDPD